MCHLMGLGNFSSSVNSLNAHGARCLDYWSDPSSTTSCVRTAKALVRLPECAGSPELSLVAYVISTIISCASSNVLYLPIPQTWVQDHLKANSWKSLLTCLY